MRWSVLCLILILIFDVWYRGHTFGPDVSAALGVTLWPATIGSSEPLDCDEAAYAYIGHRVLAGDVLYRDLTENKPPLGYWIYTLSVALGGYRELTIRVMPIPFVLGTITLVWSIARRLGGPMAACLAAMLYTILSTDPYLFGNGANLEHFLNFFALASLALFIVGWNDPGRRWPVVASGVCLGAATLIKQVAIVPAVVFALGLTWRAWRSHAGRRQRIMRGVGDLASFALGLIAIMAVAAAVLSVQGAGHSAYEDIFQYGRALATDTLPEPNAPSAMIRWLTGNADPKGNLPWPFGTTDYLVWWGTGSWPLWILAVPASAWLLIGRGTTMPRRIVAAWTMAAGAQVVLPGLYWPHYYLLPVAGLAITIAVAFGDAVAALFAAAASTRIRGAAVPRRSPVNQRISNAFLAATIALILASGMLATVCLQVRDYLNVAPAELTIRYKGGRQWVVLRDMGRELARRTSRWKHPQLYIWGWQSPLHFYARLDGPTRHFFVDNLLRDQADRGHILIAPRIEEIMAALRRQRPELIFTGYAPFGALRALLKDEYLPARMAPGLYIRRDCFGAFESSDSILH